MLEDNQPCPHCGKEFKRARSNQRFCSSQHRDAWHNARKMRGSQMIDQAESLRFVLADAADKVADFVDTLKGEK